MPLTPEQLKGHREACIKDACKLYKCEKSDLDIHEIPVRHKGEQSVAFSIRLKNEANKEKK